MTGGRTGHLIFFDLIVLIAIVPQDHAFEWILLRDYVEIIVLSPEARSSRRDLGTNVSFPNFHDTSYLPLPRV